VLADLEAIADQFVTIQLSGHIHTDDSLALAEIARWHCCTWAHVASLVCPSTFRQLDAQNPGAENQGKAFFDSLEQMLTMVAQGGIGKPVPAPLAQAHPGSSRYALEVVFVLDEFDVFACNAKKTLYNIVDTMHSNKCTMAIIGQTTRRDCVDLLEKRMKSRFSHRIFFCPPLQTQPECLQLVRTITALPADFEDEAYAKDPIRPL
jgi:origin recognition complex subunit 4